MLSQRSMSRRLAGRSSTSNTLPFGEATPVPLRLCDPAFWKSRTGSSGESGTTYMALLTRQDELDPERLAAHGERDDRTRDLRHVPRREVGAHGDGGDRDGAGRFEGRELRPERTGDHVRDFADGVRQFAVDFRGRDAEHRARDVLGAVRAAVER